MGLGRAGGSNLGAAQGSITINTSQAQQAPAVMRGVAAGINAAMGSVNTSTNKAQAGISSFAGSIGQLKGALGVGLSVAGVTQVARMAVELEAIATAYDRQQIAARSLAGSQEEVNELLEAYERASGGAIDKAQALSDVTRLQAIGFADSAEELEKFVRAARGISLATGRSQDYVIQQLQLAIANQSTMRLDQIGLGVTEVKQRVAELRSENSALTQEMAYQQAVLEIAETKFGALTDSAEAQKTGVEKLEIAWKNLRLEIGQTIQGPVNEGASALTQGIDFITGRLGRANEMLDEYEAKWRRTYGQRTSIGRVTPTSMSGEPFVEGVSEAKADWTERFVDLTKKTNERVASENESYLERRANTERQFLENVEREARDFAINRERAELDHLESIADIREDALRREARAVEELARTIGQMQVDSSERIADLREDANERLEDLEENYQEERKRSAEKFRDDILSAAGRLDAIRLLELRQDRQRELKDRQESYEEQRADLQDQLNERIDDENKALQKSITQAEDAHERQLQEARDADAQRIIDMEADFIKRKAREDADRTLRLADQAADHNAQLAEMDRVHNERIIQIGVQAAAERAELDLQHKKEMVALGVRNQAWLDEIQRFEEQRKRRYESVWGPTGYTPSSSAQPGTIGPADKWMMNPNNIMMTPPSAAPSPSTSRNVNVEAVQISVLGAVGQSVDDLAKAVRDHFVFLLEEIAGGN